MRVIRSVLSCLLLLAPIAGNAAVVNCSHSTPDVEEYHYTWRLRGGLGWLAGFVFPRTGFGDLRTTYQQGGGAPIHSELMITSGEESGFYRYESTFNADAGQTSVTYHGYQWGAKSRKERTTFDYAKHLGRTHKETPGKVEDTVKAIPPGDLRDVLTAIHYLRLNAERINAPVPTSIYSDGKEYSVVFRPSDRQVFTIDKQKVSARGFEIVDAPGGKRWPGGVRVWLSDDSRRIPFRIEIVETLASLQLDLDTIRSCGFLEAK